MEAGEVLNREKKNVDTFVGAALPFSHVACIIHIAVVKTLMGLL